MQLTTSDIIAIVLIIVGAAGVVTAVRGGKSFLVAVDNLAKAWAANQQFIAAEKQLLADSLSPEMLAKLTPILLSLLDTGKLILPAGSQIAMTEADIEALIKQILSSTTVTTTTGVVAGIPMKLVVVPPSQSHATPDALSEAATPPAVANG